MSRRWDEYMQFEDRGVRTILRCYGPGTAAALVEKYRKMGFDNVKIIGRPASRKKEPSSVAYRGVQFHQWSRSGY